MGRGPNPPRTQSHARRAQATARVRIAPSNDQARALWNAALDLADELPERGWTLVGGLMVQLHAHRHGRAGARPTEDIDILANSRERPRSFTERA
jgi:hypothetical protein